MALFSHDSSSGWPKHHVSINLFRQPAKVPLILLVYPGALFLLSVFYTRKEISTRIAIFYSANILSTAFSGLIAAATFATLDGVHGIEGWRW